ncbi:TIM barrel protein [Pseudomonas benzenivorans]|uniref:TIM barrel protein n=1 Tax=Pseudomonas benzenivorans TaxID=556533 RepID=A0ABY5H1V8_9PSED|nr:TIM barrel protein [Pseudomonas benzenivorans]UTW05984.1 TIM barrel protein [Pseudomonas benzenivorans]
MKSFRMKSLAALCLTLAGGLSSTGVLAQEGPSGQQLLASHWMHAGPTEPFSGRMWSSWSFQDRVEELGRVGFTGIGLFQDDIAYILKNEAQGETRTEKLQWMKEQLDKNGIKTVELEFLVNWMYPEGHPKRLEEQEIRDLLLEAGKVLKARHLKVGNIFGVVAPVAQLKETFADMCADTKQAGMKLGMEIMPPDPNSRTLKQALEWIGNDPDCGIYLDTWHVNHISTITYDDIAALKPGNIVAVELDDGFVPEPELQHVFNEVGSPGFIEQTVNLRRIPGDGNFDVVGFIKAVKASGYTGPWGNEILSEEYRRLPKEIAYRRVFNATSEHMEKAKQ